MKLFELQGELPIPSEEARTIVEFRAVLDKHKDKEMAIKELAYIHFQTVSDSRFTIYGTEEEIRQAIIAAVGLPEDWEEDTTIKVAMDKYTDLLKTQSSELVKEANKAIATLKNFLAQSDYLLAERTKSGGMVLKPIDLQNALIKIPVLIEQLEKAQKMVDKELENKYGASTKKSRSLMESSPIESGGLQV